VLNKACVISDDCFLGVHVVLGGKSPLPGAPYLEEKVVVHSGAVLVGPIRIGAGAVIGANAVVLQDIPPGCLAIGVPARVKQMSAPDRA
jgi:serine O-acetyltransferase